MAERDGIGVQILTSVILVVGQEDRLEGGTLEPERTQLVNNFI